MAPTLSPDRQAWREVLASLAAKTKTRFPELNGRVEKAVKLALAGDVELHADGTATVYSSSDPPRRYEIREGTCTCQDFDRAPQQLCQHRLSAGLVRKTYELLPQSPAGETAPTPAPGRARPGCVRAGHPGALRDHHPGRPFVRFEGLLAMAHERGLVALETTVVTVTSDWAVCQSTARFADGRVFTDIGDASPTNVKKHLAPHFPRMAATRASARALRRALNIDLCSVEELE